jgi:hypothetical protein
MTTLVVVAVDDFTLRIESDNPAAPYALCALASQTQARLDQEWPRIADTLTDLAVYGNCRLDLSSHD